MNKKVLVIIVGIAIVGFVTNYWLGYKDYPVTILIPEGYEGYVSLIEDQKGQPSIRLWESSIWHSDKNGVVRIKDIDGWRDKWHSYTVKYPSGKTIQNATVLPRGSESNFKRNQNLYFFFAPSHPPPDGKYFFIGTTAEAVREGFYFYKIP